MLKLNNERLLWVDNIKAVGMFLVFYVHIAEDVVYDGASMAFTQVKFIHSFVMPLFFILAGFFMKPPNSFRENLTKLFLRRLLPVFTFGILMLPLWMVFYYSVEGSIDWHQLIVKTLYYVKGSPQLNLITWFLVCLFTCEVLASLITPVIQSRGKLLLLGILLLFCGLLICTYIEPVEKLTGIAENTWYLHESIVAMGFYFIGYAVFPLFRKLASTYRWSLYVLFPIFLSLSILTYNLNVPYPDFTALLVISEHGELIPFVLAAFSGTFAMISLGILLPYNRVLTYVGKNTLYLIGLNGIFHHFINGALVYIYVPENNFFAVTYYCFTVVLLSLLSCFPIIRVLDKYLPQLFGKPFLMGPVLPDLERVHWKKVLMRKVEPLKWSKITISKEDL